jgi:TctA family transporter
MAAWFFILFIFFCLVVVAIKYDSLVPLIKRYIKSGKVNIWNLLLGVFSIFLGLVALSDKSEYSDLWGFPVHNRLWCFVFLICGIISTVSAFISKSEKVKRKRNKATLDKICISCGNITEKIEGSELFCTNCGGSMEDIKGVMDRHPELLKKMKKTS